MKTIKNLMLIGLLATCFIFYSVNLLAKDKPTDKEISNAVDNELLFNATTPSYLIDVTCYEGIVTLNGSVNNILAKDRAVKIAETVKGVRAVVDEIEVDAPNRSNGTLQADVKDALLADPATDSYEIAVTANNGVVTLNGTVQSWQEKKLSEYVAKGVVGVKEVKNNIIFDYKSNRSDYEVKNDIVQSLKNDIRIDGVLIDVSVNDGKVNLSGIVGSANEKSLALSQAWVAGVNSVAGKDLEVQEWARDKNLRKDKYVSKTDEEIKDAVKDAFLYDPRVFSFNPDVSVENGVITLTGIVSNLKAKRAAENDAKNVVGVFRVKNYLKVRPAYIPEDDDLARDIEKAMKKNSVIEKWEVDVTADNGVVYLNGTVDSYFERSTAEDIANKTLGVVAVENNLKVQDDNDSYFYNYYGWNSYYPPYGIAVESTYKTDDEIETDIVNQLWWSPYVNEDEVQVSVENGTAILAGTVDTQREKLYAEINAIEGGAENVDNNLLVSYLP